MTAEDADLRVGEHALLHGHRRAKIISAMDQGDVATQPGEVTRLFHRRITAPDDDHVLPAEERAVAHRAGAHAFVLELLFRVEDQCSWRARASGDDQRLREMQNVFVFTHPDFERARREIHLLHVRRDQLDALMLGLSAKIRHQVLPGYALGEARIVLDLGREHQLPTRDQAARIETLDAQRLQVRARPRRSPRSIPPGPEPMMRTLCSRGSGMSRGLAFVRRGVHSSRKRERERERGGERSPLVLPSTPARARPLPSRIGIWL